jgi:uncharacterized membrane protein
MKRFFMPMRTLFSSMLLSLAGIILPISHVTAKDSSVTLYTPYTKIFVPPGQSIDYSIDVINNTEAVKNFSITTSGIPNGWKYDLKSGSWAIGEISVLPGEKKNISLHIEVPLKINKGTYRFNVIAAGWATLPLAVVVSEQGTLETELTTKQPNMQGNTNATFTFNADLKNRTDDKQLYALQANMPRGWNISFRSAGRQVSSVQVEPNRSESITIEVDPPDAVTAGSYKIPVTAITNTTSASVELEVVITGSYGVELTTPTGLLSANVTAGDEKKIELQIRNTGSAELSNIKLSSNAPVNWEVTFDPKQVDKLEAGNNATVYATIKSDKKAIAGDYVTNIEAKTLEAASKISFRVSVKTSMLYGWIGVFIIAVALGGVYYLFREYGRR